MRIRPYRPPPGIWSTALAIWFLAPKALVGQEAKWPEPAIEDNSYFIEEAYNQERGVVQHISNFLIAGPDNRDLAYSFTQEWPVRTQRHQLSYTLLLLRPESESFGLGDVLLNYRLQFGAGDRRWAFAPRLSAVLPVGSVSSGRGDGSLGLQLNLPISYRLSSGIVTHWNAGITFLPWARIADSGANEPEASRTVFNLGGSVIGPVQSPVQLMLELVGLFEQEITSGGGTTRSTTWIFSPGLRAAINLGHLQIVPGVAVPISTAGGKSDTNLFFYLSFEHPFRRTDAE